MTISYKWISEYLPEKIEVDELSKIFTAIGLEVEGLMQFETIKGGLAGIVVGEVLESEQHPAADKLKVTRVNIGNSEPLKIVCGAANVAVGQKVLVATVGTKLYPPSADPTIIKPTKIRGEESQGMICAEEEIGLGDDHDGILVLPGDVAIGTAAADYFDPYKDWIYEIGLTPNRMDAMSHLGAARDVCAYLTHHAGKEVRTRSPFPTSFKPDNTSLQIKVIIENTHDCRRYSGVTISGVEIKESPKWLKDKLMAIGQRPINNIVDITNYVLHETGQPLHAFDADAIEGGVIIVKNLHKDNVFVTLDGKERSLDASDLMICNAAEGMCIAGVFGGAKSGVGPQTKNIFLESAWFNPTSIRKTSFRHGLRTEAAARFEKGVDISNTVNVLKRAALLIKEVAAGEISSDIVDLYPAPQEKTQVAIRYDYLRKLSGKDYSREAVKRILTSLDFELINEETNELKIAVPFSKPDISIPADIVEEVLRIDGLDNVDIPGRITLSPSADENTLKESLKEKVVGFLTGLGLHEIVTNSITNSRYYTQNKLSGAVKMINSLSAELDVMRVSMIETGLETIAYNLNRKNQDLQFFEFGKTYHSDGVGKYKEHEHLALYLTGNSSAPNWKLKQSANDFYRAKGIAGSILQLCGLRMPDFTTTASEDFSVGILGSINDMPLVTVAEVCSSKLKRFDIKQPVFFIDFDWLLLLQLCSAQTVTYQEVSRFPAVHRDLAVVVNKNVNFTALLQTVDKQKLSKLREVQLFDIFESEKLGTDKKSMAISFTFLDEEKTLTDDEIDRMMNQLIQSFENELGAEIRK